MLRVSSDALLMPRLPALILPFLLLADAVGAQTLREKRAGPSAPGDSMSSLVTREFELYAPTDADLRGANDEIHVAISQFAHYMGEHPKKMAFVLFRSAADADRYDSRSLARRGMQAVPWILPAKPPGRSAPAAGDPPPDRVGSKTPRDPLSHEAGHRFLIAYAEHVFVQTRGAGLDSPDSGAVRAGPEGGASQKPAGRGTATPADLHPDHPALPDWLEEAVAALCERPSDQRSRLDFMRARLDRRIPFAELLAMRRPNTGEPGGAKSGQGKAGGAGSTAKAAPEAGTAKRESTAGNSAAAERADLFCAEALSLARFIAEREEARYIGTITEGVIGGRTVGDVLNTSQNLFSKPEALEKQWLEWMQGLSRAP